VEAAVAHLSPQTVEEEVSRTRAFAFSRSELLWRTYRTLHADFARNAADDPRLKNVFRAGYESKLAEIEQAEAQQ
jgi:hypothetical protein